MEWLTQTLEANIHQQTKIPETAKDIIRKHISKYPAYDSHYSRERTRKKYLGNDLNISIMYSMYLSECKERNIAPEKSGYSQKSLIRN